MIRTPFERALDEGKITNIIPFNPAWNNSTDYYDGAVEGSNKVVLAVGEMAKSVSPMPNNRNIIFIGTPVGTVALFQRYTDKFDIIAAQIPDGIRRLNIPGLDTSVSADMQAFILGAYGEPNLGNWIEHFVKLVASFDPAAIEKRRADLRDRATQRKIEQQLTQVTH